MRKVKMLIVGTFVVTLCAGIAGPASAAFNLGQYNACMNTTGQFRPRESTCCEKAGGKWTWRWVKGPNGQDMQQSYCNTEGRKDEGTLYEPDGPQATQQPRPYETPAPDATYQEPESTPRPTTTGDTSGTASG